MKTLREKRESLSVNQQILAYATQIRQTDLSKIERGFMKIKPAEKQRICEFLGCKESDINWDVKPVIEKPFKSKNEKK